MKVEHHRALELTVQPHRQPLFVLIARRSAGRHPVAIGVALPQTQFEGALVGQDKLTGLLQLHIAFLQPVERIPPTRLVPVHTRWGGRCRRPSPGVSTCIQR